MRPVLLLVVLVSLLAVLGAAVASAHEVRPSYLELREVKPGEFAVLWKVPARGDMRLRLEPRFSDEAKASPAVTRLVPGAAVETFTLVAPTLRGQTLGIAGLEGTMTDVLARIEFADGTSWTQRLTPQRPEATIPLRQSAWAVVALYLSLGVEHILLGLDHLLFVLALLVLTSGTWRLVKTVTAFTLAHSITLALATLGFVHVPTAPVEAVIALSIVFVAAEIIHARQGREAIAARAPWLVAFTFGLLHGFGFAGALSAIGLPEGQIPLALFAFNLGVEAGQLLFVAAVLASLALLSQVRLKLPGWARLVPPYAIGSVAMVWVIERVAAF